MKVFIIDNFVNLVLLLFIVISKKNKEVVIR